MNTYIDEFGFNYIEDGVLGQGGQGKALRTKTADIALKIVANPDGTPLEDDTMNKYLNRFKGLTLLPLPSGLNISMPKSLIMPDQNTNKEFGYTMDLLDDMIPFINFLEKQKGVNIPDWLEENAKQDKDSATILASYAITGGTKRRLKALAKAATMLARLHGSGFYYGDISPTNIFISESFLSTQEFEHMWFIDADNIHYDTGKNQGSIYTRQFGAPELVQQKSTCSAASDCYSFAIMAFYILSTGHPFTSGNFVENEEEGGWDTDSNTSELPREDQALQGLIPWVDDEDDFCNEWKGGLPRILLFTEELSSLFQKTFSEKGRTDPSSRPKIALWAYELARAADRMLECVCGMSFYPEFGKTCPFCRSPLQAQVSVKSYTYIDKKQGELIWEWSSSDKETIIIPQRILGGGNFQYWENNLITLTKKEILIDSDEKWHISFDNKDWRTNVPRNRILPKTSKIYLYNNNDLPTFIEITLG